MNYEESVRWLRAQPGREQEVTLSYLDADNEAAARRFADGEEFAQVADWLDLHGTRKRILDVGCGNGIASYAMARLGHEVVALDPDESADVGLQAARRLIPLAQENGGSMRCVQGFVENLPFEDATFDAVYTRQAVHHFADLNAGLRECRRVLKAGGVFLATREHVVSNQAQLQEFLAGHALHHLHGGENAHLRSVYLRALRDAGFSRVRDFGPYDNVVNHFPISRAEMNEHFVKVFQKTFKTPLAAKLVNVPGVTKLGRSLMGVRHRAAGRLFSFLCRA